MRVAVRVAVRGAVRGAVRAAVMSLLAGLSLVSPARAERMPVAVLWVDGPGPEATTPAGASTAEAIARGLEASKELRPIDDAEARRMLVEGGPRARADQKLAEGKARFASLSDLAQADAALAEAEAITLINLPSEAACARLLEIERLRLRYAELVKAEDKAVNAATLLAACAANPSGTTTLATSATSPSPAIASSEDAAAIARHPRPRNATQPAVRVESEPAGAEVRLDLSPVGKTPLDLPGARRPDAFLDVELLGYRKVHCAVPASTVGTLAVALAKDDRVGELVDRVRAAHGNAAEGDVAELGRRVGAARILVVRRVEASLQARAMEVATAAWTRPAITVDEKSADDAVLQVLSLAAAKPMADSLAARTERPAAVQAQKAAAKAEPARGDKKADKDATPGWKRWYTWVVGGALVVGVGAFVIANHVGDDQITIHVSH